MSQHSRSNIIDLRKWFERQLPPGEPSRNCFATSHECIELLRAFTQIVSPDFRSAVIRAAREAAVARKEKLLEALERLKKAA